MPPKKGKPLVSAGQTFKRTLGTGTVRLIIGAWPIAPVVRLISAPNLPIKKHKSYTRIYACVIYELAKK